MDAVIKKPQTAEDIRPSTVARPSRGAAEDAVRTLIAWTGDDPARSGLIDTPRRVLDAFEELYGGYGRTAVDELSKTFDDLGAYDDLIVVRDVPVYSQCEHHMMPFFGRAHIGYYPSERVTGLSKLARLVDVYARRLQSQERLTTQILAAIDDVLNPRGTAVVIDAEHTCMTTRGVKAHGSRTVTTQFSGMFRDDPKEQTRFLHLTGVTGGG